MQAGGASYDFTPRTLIGDLLALGAAVTYAIYSIAGRSQRERYPLLVYAGTVYIVAALWLLPAAFVAHRPGSLNWPAVASIAALGVFPLACGHTLYNAALRRASATLRQSDCHAGGAGRRAAGRVPAAGKFPLLTASSAG